MAERPDNEVEEADQIYLLMKEDYRISRNVRLAWFLGKLNQVICPASKPEVLHSENELDLLSILPKGWQPDFSPTSHPCILMPSTRATFLARRYRFIIELDLSPSTGIVDDSTGEMIFDEVFRALSLCLRGLAQPFRVPGTDQLFKPKIFITILVYSSIIGLTSHQVLVQGCQLDKTDLKEFLQQISQQLRALESNIAEVLHQQHEQCLEPSQNSSDQSNSSDEHPHRKQGISVVSADMGLVSMVRQGILALQLLPPNSSAGIIIITDGVTSVPDVAMCETLLNQLRSGTISCSFVQVGGAYSYDCSFGYIPNVELMKFISLATFGSYLPSCPEPDLNSQEMNAYHKAFLTYSFLKTPESMNSEYFCVSQHKLFNEHLVSASGNPALVMRRKKHTEKEVHAHLISVVSVRLREGYTIREISLTKGGTQLEVKLVLLWKHNMHIEYLAATSWPLDPTKRTTRVEVTMEGSYDILHDISCTQRKPITSPYRTSVIRRFWNTLQSINQTDQMLVHLQSFNSVPENYTIPESTKNGVPLFYIPPGSTTPVLSLQHSGSKDSSQSQFASYWKPILSMDANFWQRWLHMHRIVIILEHDMPVPKHLHTPGNNGRYSTIQCRISHSALTSLLRDCSSFVLVEGYSYVKLIYSSSDQPPTSFYLVRVISKTPCMVLRLGFPIGTPAHVRNKIVDELREQILKLRFPHRVQNKEATPKTKRKAVGHPSPSKSPSIPAPKPALSDRPCVVVLSKPLEKLLIRYDKLPLDFRTPFIFNMENIPLPSSSAAPLSVAANRTASSTLASLSRYFLHRRWVWAVQSSQGPAVAMQAVAHILSMLSEIRLSEGFNFAASGEGIINMVIELPMKGMSGDTDRESHSCIVQYILFPPHSTSTKDSFSTDDDNDTEVEAVDLDTELNLVTECWVEPQCGTVVNCADQHRSFQGLKYLEIPQAIFPRDLACMSAMMTFEYLSQLCQNKDQVCSLPAGLKDTQGEHLVSEESIHMVPFQFNLIKLLPKCQQVELFFLTFSTAMENEEINGSSCLPNELLLSLFHTSLENELSDREILLAESDHVAFMHHILERERDGHVAPFSLPVIKEEYVKPPDRQDTMTSFYTTGSSKEVMGSTSTLQSFSNADLVDEEPLLLERSCSTPQWRCYAKHVSSQHLILTFLPATFTDVLMLMASGLENEPRSNVSTQEDDTLTPSNKSQADSLSGSTGGLEGSESGLSLSSKLRRSSSTNRSPALSSPSEGQTGPADSQTLDQNSWDSRGSDMESWIPSLDVGDKEGVHFSEPHKANFHISLSRQLSQQSTGDSSQLKCPVYVYNCSLENLKEQLVHPNSSRQPRDIFFRAQDAESWEMYQQLKFRSLSQDRSSPSPWTDLLAQPHKHKELANYCSLLQEHYHQSYVKGVYRSLQQSYNISSQDILMAMDYCEESLQEIDITSFLQTLCGHIRVFRDHGKAPGWGGGNLKPSRSPATFIIGEAKEEQSDDKAAVASSSSIEVEDTSEAEPRGILDSSAPTSPPIKDESKKGKIPEFPLTLLQTQPKCEVYPDLHKIIQDKFMEILSQYFKSVPSNPHYFFYSPPSSKKEESEDGEVKGRPNEELLSEAEPATEDENVPASCIMTESDTDLVVEYEEQPGTSSHREGEDQSLSDSNTVNQDQDSFSILDGDSLLETEAPQLDMPPLFVHITCSINMKSCHGSMPIQTLPTCLGEVISCLENAKAVQSVDLNELSVTLDIFVLTLPLEIEAMTDFHHNRYTSESSVNRSPGQPSSYRSDDELMAVWDGLRGGSVNGISGDPLSKLPLPHKLAILATMDEIRWLLEDEIVSALRHSRVISSATLQKVAEHVLRSSGRPHCHCEDVPLQFVFGPEQSLEKFKEEFRRMSFSGYVLNGEQAGFYYMSLSRLHPQRMCETKRLSESTASPPQHHTTTTTTTTPRAAAQVEAAPRESEAEAWADGESEDKKPVSVAADALSDTTAEAGDSVKALKPEADDAVSMLGDRGQPGTPQLQTESCTESSSPPKTPSSVSLAESVQSASHIGGKVRPSRVQSVVSSQGSLDSDMQGYDGGSSDSECESPTLDELECQSPLMPDFWLIVKIHQDRVTVYSHSRCFSEGREVSAEELEKKEDEQELPEYLRLHQMVVRKIGEICRIVNQRMLLQDLHDSHLCNKLLVAESEEDIWKSEPHYRPRLNTSDDYSTEESYQARDYLAATMQFIPGHFACDVVWSTIIYIHPRLKMGPNRAIQALRSVLNAFCVVNRKNMFVYQERTTKSVFYLRLCETSLTGKYSDMDGGLHMNRSIGLARSQEPLMSEEPIGSRSSLEGSRPVGQVDKHILLLVHGVGSAGPEITDELVKVLRKRLDEATLDIITVMLVRNCKLTPADVEFIQPSGSPATEVMTFSLPQYCLPWLSAVAHYLKQNLLIFLHVPKYTDMNTAHHFKHYIHLSSDMADGDIYLYNKPGGQGTGGKGIACIALSFVDAHGRPLQVPAQDCPALQKSENCSVPLHPDHFNELTTVIKVESIICSSEPQLYVRFDIWEQGNISPLQLSDKLQGALRHALCDVVMELRVLPNPLCVGVLCPATKAQKEEAKGLLNSLPEVKEVKDSPRQRSGSRAFKTNPSPISLIQAAGGTPMTQTSTPESTTPTGKSTRRSFWDILSKPDSAELGSPKTTDDIVQERGEEGRAARRRHKTENVKQQWSQDKAVAVELEQIQRRQLSQFEEGDAGTLHTIYQDTCQAWMTFMAKLGCPSVQQCTTKIASHFLLPSVLAEIVNLVSSLAADTAVKTFRKMSCPTSGDHFVPFPLVQNLSQPPDAVRSFILIGRNFHQWHFSTEQAHKGFQRFDALEQSDSVSPSQVGPGLAPRQRFLFIGILDKKVTLYSYNWSVDLGASLSRELVRLVKWQNARAHVVHCLFNQKMGLFHHYCFSDAPIHEMDSKQDPNPFLGPAMEPDALLRSAVPPLASKEQGRLGSSGRSLAPLHFPSELLPFDEALRDVCTIRPLMDGDVVARHGGQLLEIKAAERRELEKQMKIENLFVTWQQRSAQSNMPISGADLETLKQSSRLVHYCATPLLFDPIFRKQIQEEQIIQPLVKKRHRSSDSTASGRDRSYSTDSADMLPSRLKEEPWLLEISSTFLQQYVQYLQSMGFILVQVRPQSPARSIARARAAMLNSMSSEGRMSFSYVKQKSEDSPKTAASATTAYHLQRALPGGIVLMELAFQGCYFCVKQYALECSRIPMGQTVNSQGSLLTKLRCKQFPDATPVSDCALSMLFTEECDKVRDTMHVHSFSYDFHLRVVHQYLVGCHMTLRQGYQLTDFLDDFISHHPDIPKFGRNHVFQGSFSISTGMITAHQLYNYITDHASTYGMKPLRMSKAAVATDNKKVMPDLHEYALVALWNSSGSYKDLEGLPHHDDFDVSLVVCHNAAPFEEQSDGERHLLRLRFYVIMTSQRELFPRLTADMRRFKKLPQIHRDPGELGGRLSQDRAEASGSRGSEQDLWEESSSEASAPAAPSDVNEFYPLTGGGPEAQGLLYASPLFPLLNNEVAAARRQIQTSVEQAMGHCRRDNLWRRLFHGEHVALDKLKLAKLSFSELEELLEAVQSRSVGEIDPQLDCFLTMSPAWYQSLIKVLLSRFPQSCRHFDDNGIQYLAVLNQKFTDCFVLVFLDNQAGKTSLKVVFREPLPLQPQAGSSPPPQLVSMYHHLESVINTACYNLWTGLL
ncbi:KICSTOR complex protein SZT2 isoform X3 [Archocentrus centrarchus]|uniref:KICSTOR complex protein SZT2 isoform X3 n=1 Tax=Archocentrus centrarchus TaxID=63155 RepID=UPI0011E9E18D|nr:KICSTOR complex protein SZT2 isoform X3 [Archocentrus centrarchus]